MEREPEPGSTEAAEWEAFVEGCYEDMSITWEEVLREALEVLADPLVVTRGSR